MMDRLVQHIKVPAMPCPGCGGAHVLTMYLCPDADPTEEEHAVLALNCRWYLALLSQERMFNWN